MESTLSIRELRLGNILSFVLPNRYCQVDYIESELIGSSPLGFGSDCFNAERGLSSFMPVLLSDSILHNLGLSYQSNIWVYQSSFWHLSQDSNGYQLYLNNQPICKILFVHHLQNILFDLFKISLPDACRSEIST